VIDIYVLLEEYVLGVVDLLYGLLDFLEEPVQKPRQEKAWLMIKHIGVYGLILRSVHQDHLSGLF